MNEVTSLAQAMEVRFSDHYSVKHLIADWDRLRTLARKGGRERLNEAELAEVPALRQRLRRADVDSVLLLVLKGGYSFF